MKPLKKTNISHFSTPPQCFRASVGLGVSKTCTRSEIILHLLHLQQPDKLPTHMGHKINAVSTEYGCLTGYGESMVDIFYPLDVRFTCKLM